jgi:uncharacterized protein (TIGR02757 family)
MRFLRVLFERVGTSPFGFVADGDLSVLNSLYYRFHKGTDIVRLFTVLRGMVRRFGGIGPMMEHYYEGDFREALWHVRQEMVPADDFPFFFPKRASTSPLKRWSLYARWMVRKDEIDFGLWKFMDTSSLVVPLDANIFKIGRCRGWTGRTTQSWKAACEITDALKQYSVEDPVKFDFFLCHVVGIQGGCTGRKVSACAEGCLLHEL